MNSEIDDICDAPGIVHRAPRILLYGASGQGKSTLAATFPAPFFLDTERGTLRLDLKMRKFVDSLDDLMDALYTIEARRPTSIKTVVIDTIDWLIDLAAKQVCAEHRVKNLEDIEYKKGYAYVHDKVQALLLQLTRLNDMGYAILLVAHARDEVIKLPGLDPFRIWNLKIVGTQAQAKQTAEKIREWCDEVYFLDKDVKVDKGVATGGQFRVLYAQATPSIIAKSRYGLAAKLILDEHTLDPIFEAINQSVNTVDAPTDNSTEPETDETGFSSSGLDSRLKPYSCELLHYSRRMGFIQPAETLSKLPAGWSSRMNANVDKVIEQCKKEAEKCKTA